MSNDLDELYDVSFNKVKAHMKWDDNKTAIWFSAKNPLLGYIAPLDFMRRRPEKFEKWVDGLIDESTAPTLQEPSRDEGVT